MDMAGHTMACQDRVKTPFLVIVFWDIPLVSVDPIWI